MNARHPIALRMPKPAPGRMRRIVFETATGAANGSRGSMILRIPERPIEDVVLRDVAFVRDLHPDAHMLGEQSPAGGIWARHAKGIALQVVAITSPGAPAAGRWKHSGVDALCRY